MLIRFVALLRMSKIGESSSWSSMYMLTNIQRRCVCRSPVLTPCSRMLGRAQRTRRGTRNIYSHSQRDRLAHRLYPEGPDGKVGLGCKHNHIVTLANE